MMAKKQTKPRRILTVMEGRKENAYMVEGFSDAAKKKNWDFCHLLNINSDNIARFDFDDIPLDFVVFRELSNNNYHEVERVMYWLKNNHKLCINTDVAGRRFSTSDKHFQQGLFLMDPILKEYALPTFEAKSKANVKAYLAWNRVHYPIVLKDRRGTTGKNITLINNEKELDEVEDYSELLIEQYIRPVCDYRVFVIGGTAVGTMQKKGDMENLGDFKAWSAGRERHLEKDPELLTELTKIATRAAAVSKLEYAGIDIIREAETDKLYILETNIAAGWPNFTPITHIDIPSLVIEWFEDVDDGRKKTIGKAVSSYTNKRKQYLPVNIKNDYESILKGGPVALDSYQDVFDKYPNQHLYDAGWLFNQLSAAYQDVISNPKNIKKYEQLIQEIESMPLSWAGNFIGPEVGTLHDGAILSALYLYLLHKSEKM